MGRLDDAAKHKVVELRKAGLSFRKIKAVLELDNIKVSAQAIYLFLREFQGRPPGRVCPVDTSSAKIQAHGIGAPEKWSAIHLQNIIRSSSQQSQQCGFIPKSTNPSNIKPLGSCSSSSSNHQQQGHEEDNEIKIVSVSSLAQTTQTVSQAPATRATANVSCTTGTVNQALMRRRVSPSPATSSMLAARKRILDKALSHRIKSFQQVTSLLRRDQTSAQGDTLRNVQLQQQTNACNSNERTALDSQSKGLGGASPLHFSVQRPSLSVRSPQPPPRVGIRLPSQSVACSVSGTSNVRLPIAPNSQTICHNEGNSSPQQTAQDSRMRVLLQDQIQNLSSEVRVLGVAVKMLVEQQCRLEREQAQQTNIQKQILSTLQSMSSKIGCCRTVQQQHKTPSPSASKSTSFNQDSFTCSQDTYNQCSQTQPSFNAMDVLESANPFKLPEFSSTSMNGFAACSSAESLPLISSPLYQEPNAQAHMPGFTQNYASAYSPTNNQTFTENKLPNFSNSCAVRAFQDCNISNAAVLSLNNSMQDQVNNIKVEGP